MRRIVHDHVQNVMQSLAPEEQDLCARIFERLVTGIGSKVAYPTKALAGEEVLGPGVDEKTIEAVLSKLTPKEARILKPVTTSGQDGFEIFHDVLGLPVLQWRRAFQTEKRRREEVVEADTRRHEELARANRRFRFAMAVAGVVGLAGLGAAGTAVYVYQLYSLLERQQEDLKQEQNKSEQALVNAREARGHGIWVGLDFAPEGLSEGHVDALWQVATSTGDLRRGFLAPLSTDPPDLAVVKRLIQRPESISRALGLASTRHRCHLARECSDLSQPTQ